MINCLRCGKCCYYVDSNGVFKPCKYLIHIKNYTSCIVYRTRLGREIDKGVKCGQRNKQGTFIEGCPYNEVIK